MNPRRVPAAPSPPIRGIPVNPTTPLHRLRTDPHDDLGQRPATASPPAAGDAPDAVLPNVRTPAGGRL